MCWQHLKTAAKPSMEGSEGILVAYFSFPPRKSNILARTILQNLDSYPAMDARILIRLLYSLYNYIKW